MLFALLSLGMASAPPPDTARAAQGVEYRIEAVLDEARAVLHGRARLRYTNRAPAALDTLYFHQHLNAFRPNSAWARRELQFGERRFQDLGPAEHAFERLTAVAVAGRAVRPVYPGAPDSTVVAVPLPAPLKRGESVTLTLDWQARPSTLPRRQGRQGRHYDWAQWYPRIAVYERGAWQVQPLLPQGEFYGEFARYDVTLDVAADQVLGATGVPVEGDPGWRLAGRDTFPEALYRRDAYARRAAEPLGLLAARPAAGRKRVRWLAEPVHHFAWSADPRFRYEGERQEIRCVTTPCPQPPAFHVLYLPADTTWDDGVALRRTQRALAWLEGLFGAYPWPQLTNLRRIEGGGTEFPMLVMNGSASEGLIVHEVAHQYLHGILANNEWKEGWLDEGLTDFVTSWYFEEHGRSGVWAQALERARRVERQGLAQPIGWPGAEFRDPGVYGAMTYTKASLVMRMLRDLLGEDTMRRVLRTYSERYRFQHVREADFRAVAEEVSGRELSWFFRQWLHTTATLDYAITDARTRRLADGRWQTRVEVERRGEAWMPVRLQVGDTLRLLESREPRQVVEVVTAERPQAAVLDPQNVLLDVEPANHRAGL